jgi:hypothetical protein
VGGAGVLALAAIGAVIVVPRLVGPTDPGCKEYSGPAITAYNKTINDLNAQASQATLTADMTVAISSLNTAISKAHSTTVKAALTGLLTDLKGVQADVSKGSVPTKTVDTLNNASNYADQVCS